MEVSVVQSLADLDAAAWNELVPTANPFVRYGFLRALEESGSVGPGTGWGPHYVLAREHGVLVGAVCAYVKTDSYGEYIFDWAWASASERAGLPYYPKLVVAVPFTPVTGPRILLAPGAPGDTSTLLVAAVDELATAAGCSSTHWLFTTEEEARLLADSGYRGRASFQFHWANQSYEDFDGFLSALTSRKRKQVRKERSRARESVDGLDVLCGDQLTEERLDELDELYRRNVWRHGGFDYLRAGFFHRLVEREPDTIVLGRATQAGETVAMSLFLLGSEALFGRYWGSDRERDCLHFELSYYTGIDVCIDRGLQRFEAGAQGVHKLLRGFLPTRTYSAHRIAHPQLREAIERFLAMEAQEVAERMIELEKNGPYRSDACE